MARWLALLLLVGQAGCGRTEPPPLLLVVTVDTLRADRLGLYGSPLGLSPRLDALAKESTVFESAWAPAPFTLASVASLWTGRHPVDLGVYSNYNALPEDAATTASVLREHDVRTGAVVSNFVLRPGGGIERGFEIYDARFPGQEQGRNVPERIASDTTEAALAVLDQMLGTKPASALLWVHYQDPHGPYTPPEPPDERLLALERQAPDGSRRLPFGDDDHGDGSIPLYQRLGEEREVATYRAHYGAEVAATDAAIGALLDGVKTRGLWEETWILFTADHGESLGEEDYWFAHGERVSEPLLRVPLLVRSPGRPGERRRDVASLLDVHATVLGRLGLRADGVGRDLLAGSAPSQDSEIFVGTWGYAAVPQYGLVAEGHRLRWRMGRGAGEALDAVSLEDGSPTDPDAPELAHLVLRLQRRIGSASARSPGPMRELGPDTAAKLRALGYAE